MSPGCCIFKVPNILKRHNPKAYVPNAFSIGPHHYGKKHLKATQKIKLKYLDDLISSFPGTDPKTMLRTLIGAISDVQQEARDCYAEPIDHISADELVKILVIDGCFLVELFRRDAYQDLQKDDDPIFTISCMCQFLCHDLILLENQIPWLVLQRLFDMTWNIEDSRFNSRSLTSLVLDYLSSAGCRLSSLHPNTDALSGQLHSKENESRHILDILRNSLVLSFSITHTKKFEWQSMPSATRLREAGIKFKKGTSSESMILDIKFKDGVLEIPPLDIHENTESLFRNLICLEQCLPDCASIVTSYAVLLDNLINTTEDMEILCDSGIIDNWLGIDDATGFFNRLYHDTYVKENYYYPLTAEVNKYCQRHWPRHRTVLMRDYFNNPWALVSVIAATILLILTFLQTLFTIIV